MAKRKAAKASTGKKPLTKSQVIATLAESNECSKKEVANLFDELATLIGKNLGKRGPGVFTIPGMAKIKVVRKKEAQKTMRKHLDEQMKVHERRIGANCCRARQECYRN